MLMSCNVPHRIVLGKHGAKAGQRIVLCRLKRTAFNALELDANRVIVAIGPPPDNLIGRRARHRPSQLTNCQSSPLREM